MKISKLVILLSLFTASTASAKDGFYLGLDANQSRVRNLVSGIYFNQNVATIDHAQAFSIDLGYNFDLREKFFLAPEVFYDKIDSSAHTLSCAQSAAYCSESIKLENRYGIKLNAGYHVKPNFNVFVNAGISNVNWTQTFAQYNKYIFGVDSLSDVERNVMLYGFGFSYDLSEKLALRTSYDFSTLRTKYFKESELGRNKVDISMLKFGILYKF